MLLCDVFIEVLDSGGEGVDDLVCAGLFGVFGLGVEQGVEGVQ